MTVYFKQHDWEKLRANLHRLQGLLEENSEAGYLVDASLEILESTDRDAAMEELRQEENLKGKKAKGGKDKGEGDKFWIAGCDRIPPKYPKPIRGGVLLFLDEKADYGQKRH
jgi:hypothetical protein